MKLFKKNRGFTLIELLVVISIIAILSSIILASLSSARDQGHVGAGEVFESSTYNIIGVNAVGRWTFDDLTPTGTTVLDTSGNNYTGMLSSTTGGVTPSSVTPSNYGQSVYIDNTKVGIDDITMGATPLLSITQGSIAAWIKASPTQAGAYSYGGKSAVIIARKMDSSYVNYGLFLIDPSGGSNVGQLAVQNGGASSWIYNSAGPLLNDNKWHYVALSFNNGVVNGSHLYVDGAITDTFTFNITAANGGFSVGDDGTGYYGYQGYIDNLVVYSNVISAEAVWNNYVMGLSQHALALK